MSFGFSVGDFIAAADLINRVISALREAGGSASQYQHITNKLGFLDRAIRDVNRLEPVEGLEATLEAIKTTALSCQLPLLEYLENIRSYNESLGRGQSSGVMKDVISKMKWQVSKKLEAAMKLEAEIVAYLGAINLLLSLYEIKVNTLSEQRARCRFESLTRTLQNLSLQTQTVSKNVAQVRHQVEQGTRAVREDIKESSKETSLVLRSLQQNCSASISEFLRTAGALSEVTLQTFSKVSEIYNTVLWVRTRLSEPDTRHTWLQEPMRWEDAYGRVIPIPAEFDYPMMEGALRGHFQKGRGKKLVERNQWQLFDPSRPQTIFSAQNWEPFPGMEFTMAMIIPQSNDQIVCPRLNCSSKSYTDVFGGGKICAECKTWFDSLPNPSAPQKITEIVDSNQHSGDTGETQAPKLPPKLNRAAKSDLSEDISSDSEFEVDEEDLLLLKNARVRHKNPKRAAMQVLPATESEDKEELYAVRCILAEKGHGEDKIYLIEWMGYDIEESTWEPASNVFDKEALKAWDDEKLRQRQGLSIPFDIDELGWLKDRYEAEKRRRAAKMAKWKTRRALLGLITSDDDKYTSSDEYISSEEEWYYG